jgi:muconolactone delta-isomerase
MAQFIAICRRAYGRFSEADFTQELLDAEAEQARRLYVQGVFRSTWGHQSPAGAVVLMEAESREAAGAALATLPLAQRDMLDIEVLAVGPYRGFGPRT